MTDWLDDGNEIELDSNTKENTSYSLQDPTAGEFVASGWGDYDDDALRI